ncbi:MAG: prepilin peptidase [Bdellovibrionota bacterium]|nr:prepilin peptidase [Bdellovibrionota bacterium]
MNFPLVLLVFLAVELAVVSYIDIKYRKISNYWSLLNISLFVASLFVFPKFFFFSFSTFFYPLVFLGVGFFLFTLKIMGGGDSKFLFSFFLLVPEMYHELFFLKLIYSTIAIGLYLLIYNTAKNFDKLALSVKIMDVRGIKSVYGTKFAYAPVIAISWVAFSWDVLKEYFK